MLPQPWCAGTAPAVLGPNCGTPGGHSRQPHHALRRHGHGCAHQMPCLACFYGQHRVENVGVVMQSMHIIAVITKVVVCAAWFFVSTNRLIAPRVDPVLCILPRPSTRLHSTPQPGVMGGAVAGALRACGYPTSCWVRTPRPVAQGVRVYVGQPQLREFVSQCDALICMLPLTPNTRRAWWWFLVDICIALLCGGGF